MKRILLAATILALALPAFREANAGVEISVDFFYDNLGPEGNWVELEDYGYCWQPSVAVNNPRWRPYADGYWAYTDVGWTWVSHEDFGWATYHYGRWARLRDRGWFWVPGREWGPAWVSWRSGGDYVGWAPLPPRGGGEVVYDNEPISGQVDVEFDIGPAYYNFVDVRYIGEPALQERIFEPSANVTYITQTVNVTNITYTNSTVYNHGPDYDRLSQYSTRPIRRMTLERNANTDPNAKPNELTKVQGDKLIVAAPQTIQKPANPVAPKTVKEKIAKPKLEHGWGSVPDPKAQADLRQKMKSENPKNVLPPGLTPHANPEAAQSPTGVSPASPVPHQSVAPTPDNVATRPLPPERMTPTKQATPPGIQPKQSLPPERVTPPKANVPSDNQPKRPLPPERVTPPKPDVPSGAQPKRPLPPERVTPPKSDVPSDNQPKRPLPSDRVTPPKPDAPPDVRTKRPLPPERVTPPKRDVPPDNPASRVLPPRRDVPSDVPHKQLPPERVAPPPGPPQNGPVKPDDRNKRPSDKKGAEPSPAPGM